MSPISAMDNSNIRLAFRVKSLHPHLPNPNFAKAFDEVSTSNLFEIVFMSRYISLHIFANVGVKLIQI
jgi:hypothetical protein